MKKMMDHLRLKLRAFNLNKTRGPVILAISGGVDSMVLLDLISKLNQETEFKDLEWIIAHFNHHLRKSSHQEATMIKDFATRIDMPYFIGEWNQPAQNNIEALARHARYQFFAQVCQRNGSRSLLTAHHLSDQVETFLMRLIRGSSIKGWQGIKEISSPEIMMEAGESYSINLFRPLLEIDKQTIYDYAHLNQVPYIEDESNHTDQYFRNRIRHQIVPLLNQENPKFLDHLDQFIKDYQTIYQAHYENFLVIEPRLILPNPKGGWILNLATWTQLRPATLSIYLRIFFEERLVYKIPTYSQKIITEMERLMLSDDNPNGQLNLSNSWVIIRSYNQIFIQPQKPVEIKDQIISLNVINQWYSLGPNEYIGIFEQNRVTSEVEKGETLVYHLRLKPQERIQFYIRHRQSGDKMTLKTTGKKTFTKKVRRIFIDQKISKWERQQAWIVCDAKNQPIWIIGLLKGFFRDIKSEKEITHSILYQKKSPDDSNLC